MQVVPVPCLRDNYAYILICEQTGKAAVVDPSKARPVQAAVERMGVELTAILNTHHHPDHVGGNQKLLARFGEMRVYGHKSDKGRIPGQTDFLEEGDTFSFGNLTGEITHNPGHTSGAITFYIGDCAFTGDTLFAAGCGRLFEGTAAEMYSSLNEKIGSRPENTRLFFGHEYTEANLRFARTVEPENKAIQARLKRVREMRRAKQFTTPTTVALERATNPFMRCDSPELIATVKRHDSQNDGSPAEVLRVVRELKDKF